MSEVLGIDVSHHNGRIDWQAVAHDNRKFAIMKCQYEAQSHRIDETFEYNYSEAGKYGLARGVYIYIARASIANPQADAEALLNHLKGRALEYGIWLDLEDKSLEVMGKAYIRDLAFLYSDIFMKAGYYVGIYCNKDWYSRLIHEDLKRDFDFWIARYPKDDNGRYNSTSSLNPSHYAVAWQYSSKGNVAGVKTRCDLNVDFDGIINLIASSKPEVAKNPYKLTERVIKEGSMGDSVAWVQWELCRHGYNLKVDKIFGKQTKLAVLLFQKDHGLLADSIVGPKTIAALQN